MGAMCNRSAQKRNTDDWDIMGYVGASPPLTQIERLERYEPETGWVRLNPDLELQAGAEPLMFLFRGWGA
jgi:hypothetical protein